MPRFALATRAAARELRLAATLVAAALVGSRTLAEETPAFWLAPVSGNWNDATKWSTAPGFPSNTAAVDFDVTLNATGAKYTVYTPVATAGYPVGRLTLDSPDVTLLGGVTAREVDVRQGTWWLSGGDRVVDARITIGSGGKIDLPGTIGPLFSNVTLASDLAINWSTLAVAGSLTLDNATVSFTGPSSSLGGGDLRGHGRVVLDADLGRLTPSSVIESGIEVVVESNRQVSMGRPDSRTNFVNQGTINVNPGATLGIYSGGSWANQGTITLAAGSTLYADGLASWSALGAVNRSASTTLIWTPTLDAPGTVLDLNTGPLGPWELGRATLTGVTVKADGRTAGVYGPVAASVTPPPLGVLTGVTLAANLDFQQDAGYSVREGLTLADASVHFKANSTVLNFDEVATAGGARVAQTLGGTGELVFDAPEVRNYATGFQRSSEIFTNSTLTIASGVTVRTGTGDGQLGLPLADGTYPTVVNQGTLSARGAGRTITLAANLVNDGTVEAVDGGVISLMAPFTNRATFRVTDATVRVGGASKLETVDPITMSNATVEITGAFDNTGRTVDVRNPARGFTLALGQGGTIVGGTVTSADGTPLRVTGSATLTTPVIDAPILVAAGGALTLNSTARVNAGITLEGASLTLSRAERAVTLNAKAGSSVSVIGASNTQSAPPSMAGWTLDGTTVSVSNYPLTAALLREVSATNSTLLLQRNAVLNNAGDTTVTGGLTLRVNGGKISGGRIEGATATSAIAADLGTLENVTVAASVTNRYFGQPILQVVTIAGTFAMEPNRGAPVTMTVDGQAIFSTGSVSTINGTLAGSGTVTLNSNARLEVQRARGVKVEIADGATLALMSSAQGGGLSHVPSIFLSAGTTLDVADVPMIFDFWSTPRGRIASGYAGGAWSGKGVTSSYAATHPGTAIGYASAADLLGSTQDPAATLLGETVAPTATLIRLTQAGDATLDGVVNFDDLLRLAKNYGQSPTSSEWYRGDFNYDAIVNFDDLLILAKNYNGVMPDAPWSLSSPAATFSADLAAAFAGAAVPEPSALAFAFLAPITLGRRRRP
jgi:hypothetical protein